jgi:predicted DNA-binding transcriptional regulator YafY
VNRADLIRPSAFWCRRLRRKTRCTTSAPSGMSLKTVQAAVSRQLPDGYFLRLRSIADGSVDPAEPWLANPAESDVALTPTRDVDRRVLRAILAAIRDKRSVEILYQSKNRAGPDPSWRAITPHALGYDGLLWRVRAFSPDENGYAELAL